MRDKGWDVEECLLTLVSRTIDDLDRGQVDDKIKMPFP